MSSTKIDENKTNILKLLFFLNKFTLCRIKRNIYLQKTSRNAKKTQTDQGIPRALLLCLKRNDPQTFKSGICKNPFLRCACYWHNLLRWIFLSYVITGRHYFHESLLLLWDFFKHHVASFFEASVLKEIRILCVISIITTWC